MRYLVAVLIALCSLYGEYGDWQTLTYPGTGSDIIKYGNNLAITSSGMLILVDDSNQTIIDSDDGLYSTQILKVELDYRGVLWLLHPNGSISLYKDGDFQYLTDFPQNGEYQALDLAVSDKYIYVSSTEKMIRYRFDQNYSKYVVDENNTDFNNPNIALFNSKIYIYNDNEIKTIDEDSDNFNIMFWVNIGNSQNLSINGVVQHSNELLFLTNNGVFTIKEESLEKWSLDEEYNFLSGYSEDGVLYLLRGDEDENTFYSYADDQLQSHGVVPSITSNTFVKYNNQFIFSCDETSFFTYNLDGSVTYPSFNLPQFGNLSKMDFSQDGKVVYSSNSYVSFFDNSDYKFHNDYSNPNTTLIRSVYVDKSNTIYAGTWGEGFFSLGFDSDSLEVLDNFYFNSDEAYPVSPSVIEHNDKLYFVNWAYSGLEADHLIETIDTTDSTRVGFNIGSMYYGHELFVDSRDQLWVGSLNQAFQPLPGATFGIKNLTTMDSVTIELGLAVKSITEDKNGVIWIGSTDGVYYLDLNSVGSTSSITSSDFKKLTLNLSDNFVNDIAVNDLNEKWIATANGVNVLSGDNSKLRFYFPRDGKVPEGISGDIVVGPMIDSEVKEIMFDKQRNLAIFLYNGGFSFLNYSGVTTDSNISEFATNPSPFLCDGSTIMQFVLKDVETYDSAMIYNLRGDLIRGGMGSDKLEIFGGWDGRDNDDTLVGSGIYQVVVYDSDEPTKNLTGKIAVVRK